MKHFNINIIKNIEIYFDVNVKYIIFVKCK